MLMGSEYQHHQGHQLALDYQHYQRRRLLQPFVRELRPRHQHDPNQMLELIQ